MFRARGWRKLGFSPEDELKALDLRLSRETALWRDARFIPGAGGAYSYALVLADNAFVQQLNRDFRQLDRPTDVLSFAALEGEGDVQTDGVVCLGDVILALERFRHDALELKREPHQHFQRLVVHGILHLLGFDHQNEAEAEIMEGWEERICSDGLDQGL